MSWGSGRVRRTKRFRWQRGKGLGFTVCQTLNWGLHTHFLLVFKIILSSQSCFPHFQADKTEALERSDLAVKLLSDKNRIPWGCEPRRWPGGLYGSALVVRIVTGLQWPRQELATCTSPFRVFRGRRGPLTGALLECSFRFCLLLQQYSSVNILWSDLIILSSQGLKRRAYFKRWINKWCSSVCC